jgi:demethylmenaquinone methyltransferase/2-methoxy-6-polyprenyl-1,4-benzoquinol methylase
MANKYFSPGAERAEKVEDLFATLASRYDLINDLQSLGLHRLWKARLIRLAAIQPGDSALDVCCGTGDVTFRLAKAGARATGIDFSQPMLDVAASRATKRGSTPGSPVRFLQGDALHLPFPDASFDVVTISYGLRNLADFEGGLRELTRVLRPDGRLLVLDFGKPAWAPWRWIYFQHLRWVCPAFGRLFCGDGDTHGYILDSLKAYPAQTGVDAALQSLGYAEHRIIQLLGGMMSINLGRRTAGPTGDMAHSRA